jgi:hypothetical protein
MRRSALLIPGIALAWICGMVLCSPAAAQIYKWVDDQGKVHYSDNPPANQQNPKGVKILDDRSPYVSVYETPPRQPATEEVEALRQEVHQLHREIESTRELALTPPAPSASELAAAYERCIAERRVDCDSHPEEYYYPEIVGYVGYPPVVGWRPGRPALPPRPHPSPRKKPPPVATMRRPQLAPNPLAVGN